MADRIGINDTLLGRKINADDGRSAFALVITTDPSAPIATAAASQPALTTGTNRSGTATTTSGGLSVPANANRKALVGQNVSTVNVGFNEFGGTAAIGSAGTYTVPPNGAFSISTTGAVNFISASATAAVTMTET